MILFLIFFLDFIFCLILGYYFFKNLFFNKYFLNFGTYILIMSELKVFDIRGREIKVGDYVKYINTGTVGEVTEIMEDEEGIWAFLDTTELYYKIDFLELTDEIVKKEAKSKDLEADIEERIRIREAAIESLQNIESRDAPGGAG